MDSLKADICSCSSRSLKACLFLLSWRMAYVLALVRGLSPTLQNTMLTPTLLRTCQWCSLLLKIQSHIVYKAPLSFPASSWTVSPRTDTQPLDLLPESFLGSHKLSQPQHIFPQTCVWPMRHSSHLLKEAFPCGLN